jgi:hypothetical protein
VYIRVVTNVPPENAVVETEAARSVALRLGLPVEDAVVIGEGTNVLVHLRPQPVVARVPDSHISFAPVRFSPAGLLSRERWVDMLCSRHR